MKKLAFYYHTPVVYSENRILIPSYLGVFIDELANKVEELTLVLHEAQKNSESNCNYELKSKNIKWINIGFAKPAWYRTLFPNLNINNIIKDIEVDCLLVRSPTPLAVGFLDSIKKIPVYFLIVGDYLEGAEHLKKSGFRNWIIYYYLKYFDFIFTKAISKTKILVNSPALYNKYINVAKDLKLIKTTTISNKDLLDKKEERIDGKIILLYTGRIDPAKGLFELVSAVSILNKKNIDVQLDIVGWEDSKEKKIQSELTKLSIDLGISERLKFHGKKKVGSELNYYYKNSDIYVIPSYHEGFPRTIWEAMANCLPVIATSVGGIPDYLESKKNCILIPPKDIQSIVESVEKLVFDNNLKNKIVQNASIFVKENTLEKQTEILVQSLICFNNEQVL